MDCAYDCVDVVVCGCVWLCARLYGVRVTGRVSLSRRVLFCFFVLVARFRLGVSQRQFTPLNAAVKEGHYEAVQWLLSLKRPEHRVSVNQQVLAFVSASPFLYFLLF